MSSAIRRDGKRARTPRLGVPAGSPPPPTDPEELLDARARSWYELVLPPDTHNRADAAGTLARREERGQVTPHTGVLEQEFAGQNRQYRRAIGGRGWNPGRLVLHPGRARARSRKGIAHPVTAETSSGRRAAHRGAHRQRDDRRGNLRRRFALEHADGSPVGAYMIGFADGCFEAYSAAGDVFTSVFTSDHRSEDHVPWLRGPYSHERWNDLTLDREAS